MIQSKTVDITPMKITLPVIEMSQYDLGREIIIHMKDGNDWFDLTGYTAKLQGTKPSGFGYTVDGVVDGHDITFASNYDMTSEAGFIPSEVRLTKDGVSLGSLNVMLHVEKTPHDVNVTDGSPETIVSEITELVERAESQLSALLPTDTASGDIASFPDGTDLFPALSVKAQIEPIQDLHGYDSPWVGGAGKNKANLADGTRTGQGITGTVSNQVISASGTATATYANINCFNAISITSGQTYTVRLSKSVSNAITFRFATDNTDTTYQQVNVASGSTSATFTANNNFTVFRLYISGLTSGNTVNISGLQVLVGEGNISAFEPYENICPISGHDSVETWRSGRNLLDTSYGFDSRTTNGVTFTVNADKSITINGTATSIASFNLTFKDAVGGSKPMPQLAGKTATAKCKNALTNPRINIDYFKTDGTNGGIIVSLANDNAVTRTLPSDFYSFRAYIVVSAGVTVNNVTLYPQIELGTEVAEYEPCQGASWTTSLGRTVYGGTLDVVSGVLTVDRAMITLNGSETWAASNGTATACMRVQTRTSVGFKPNTSNVSLVGDISSAFVEATPNRTWDGTIGFSVSTDANPYLHFCQTGQKNMSVEAWKTYLASNPIQVVGLLATPQTYQLTPTEVDLLLGQNNLWTDCGSVEVTYKADVGLYIDKKLSSNGTRSLSMGLTKSATAEAEAETEPSKTETDKSETR